MLRFKMLWRSICLWDLAVTFPCNHLKSPGERLQENSEVEHFAPE